MRDFWKAFGGAGWPGAAAHTKMVPSEPGSAMWNFSARQVGVAAILAASALVFGLIIYHESGSVPDETGAAAPVASDGAPPARPVAPGAGTSLPPVESYGEVTRRPLFSSTRQPAPPEAQEGSGKAGSLALVGIIIGDDGRTALIEHGQPAALVRLKEGQTIEGWTLKTILPDRVTLLGGGSQQELRFKDRSAPPPSAPARR